MQHDLYKITCHTSDGSKTIHTDESVDACRNRIEYYLNNLVNLGTYRKHTIKGDSVIAECRAQGKKYILTFQVEYNA